MAFKYFDKYRVKRDLSQQSMMLKLRDGKIFKDYSSVMMAAGMVGYINDESKPIATAAEPVQLSFFSDRDRMVIDLIAFAASGGNQRIVNEEEKYRYFEEYVVGGFPLLCKLLQINEQTDLEDERTRQQVIKKFYSLTLRPDGFICKD